MSGTFLARVVRGYREIGARVGFFAALVALSAALGALIALPLWLFATSRPRAYTAAVLAAAAGAVLVAVVRRGLSSPAGRHRAAVRSLAVLVGVAKAILLLAGLYAAAAFAARGLYPAAAAGGVVFLAAAAWIGYGVAAGAARKPPGTDR